jgi:glycine/D-amino acid oxidase-like deaminating enzyme
MRTDTTPEVQALLERNLYEFPAFAKHVVEYRWAGTEAVSCDGLPLAGAVPGRARLLVIGGFGMNGLGWTLAAAEVVAQLLLQGRAEHAAAFTPRRFL